MKYLRIFSISIVYLLLITSLYAQVIPLKGPKAALFKPLVYNNPEEGIEKTTNETSTDLSRQQFVVYSDRDDNIFYSDNEVRRPNNAKANFMDPFIVIEVHGNNFHLIKFDPIMQSNLNNYSGKEKALMIPAGSSDYGWISKDYLLLWTNCLVTKFTNISLKALSITNDPSVLSDPMKFVKDSSTIKLFNHPSLASDDENKNTVKIFNYIFIYKETPTSYLIGTKTNFTLETSKSVILGWVDKRIMTKWSDRICYEPNFDQDAARERKNSGKKASLFSDSSLALNFYNGQAIKDNDSAQWSSDSYEKRAAPEVPRFPSIRENKRNGLIETGFVTSLFDQQANVSLSENDLAKVQKGYAPERENITSINVVFVIDEDESLKEYRTPILNAIEKSANGWLMNQDITNNHVQFGAVVYGSKCQESRTISTLTSLSSDITGKLKQLSLTTDNCSKSSDYRALYSGLEEANQLLGGNKKRQTNIIVIIGSRGDSTDLNKETQLVNNLAETEPSIYALQVVRGEANTFSFFQKQISNLINGTCKAIEKNNLEKGKKLLEIAGNRVNIHELYINPNGIWSLKYPDESPVPGFIQIPKLNKPLNYDAFSIQLDTLIVSFSRMSDEVVAQLDNEVMKMGNRDNVKINPMLLRHFVHMLDNVDAKTLSGIVGNKFQFFLTCYIKKEAKDPGGYPYFKTVLLMTTKEYFRLAEILDKFDINESGHDLTLKLQEAFLGVLTAYYGSDAADIAQKYKNKKLSEIDALISGLPSKESILSQHTLKDFESEKNFPQAEVTKLAKYMIQKREDYNRYYTQASNMRFQTAGNEYIWVPEDKLP